MPEVSVIIPVYKTEEFLKECLDSVINQTFKDIEIICVNDCSPDSCAEILKKYNSKDKRIKIINHEQNKGLGPARNTGMKYAKGKYIFFLDSDDYIQLDIIEKSFNKIKQTNSDIVISKSKAFTFGKSEYLINRTRNLNKWLNFTPNDNYKVNIENYANALHNIPCVAWGRLYLTKFLKNNNIEFIDKNVIHEDNGFHAKILSNFPSLSLIEEIGVMYRVRENSLSTNIFKKENEKIRYKNLKIVIRDALKYIKNRNYKFSDNIQNMLSQKYFNYVNYPPPTTFSSLKVSVIIPLYNMEKYLCECLDSVINQTLDKIEIILIDDGSTDNSGVIADEYAQKQTNVRVVHTENHGAGPARNLGIDSSIGEYVCFIDPDDFYPDKNILENLYLAAKTYKADIVGGSFSIQNDTNGEVKTQFDGKSSGYTFKKEGFISFTDYQYHYGFHRFLYKRELLNKNMIRFPDYKRYEDPVFMVKAMITAKKFYAIPNIVYRYRLGHKKPFEICADERKVNDGIKGITDVMRMAMKNDLPFLYELAEDRLKSYVNIFSDLIQHQKNNIKKFRIRKWIKYKILSKLTFGNTRKRYKTKYQEQKDSYRNIIK